MRTSEKASELQVILQANPYAHFHTNSLCFDDECLDNKKQQGDVFYPSWCDLWQHQNDGLLLRDHVFRIFCKNLPGFNLAVQHDKVVLLPANTQDESQQWWKDESYSLRVKDSSGQPAFGLINKATGKMLKHGKHKGEEVHLMEYNVNIRDDDIMWTDTPPDYLEDGFKALRFASNILLNLTIAESGNALKLDTWHKKDHQLWKVFPLC